MEIVLANPRGFCAGVDRAIAIVNRALECFNPPIYVRHEVVHNKFVVDDLRQRGAIFVDELDEVPDDNIVIFSAHGVSKAVQQEAERRGLKVFDATCPLVTKVHIEVTKYAREGTEAILIGHEGHPEVEGTMGQYDKKNGGAIYLVEDEEDVASLIVHHPEKVAFVTQTTLSIDDTAKVIDGGSCSVACRILRNDAALLYSLSLEWLSLVTPSTSSATILPNFSTISSLVKSVSSITSCNRAAMSVSASIRI